jgi:hypothetical protein
VRLRPPLYYDVATPIGDRGSTNGIDPFDRMLVAQAAVEDLTLVSRDESIALYEVDILKV